MTANDNLFYRKERKRIDARALLKKVLKNRRAVLAVIVGAPILLYVVFGHRGILQRIRLEREKTALEVKIRAAEAEGKALQAESKALDGDKKAVEKAAREKYNMVKEGEHVYKVNPEK